ncbi:MAG: methionine ABC transporter ATP-binding protein, partial [Eubacteriales bacterium]|nr:methionine ABC transporter ATP-binding protein [Eubacteriales bacterium]
MISLEKVNKNFNGEKVLEDVSLKINEGEVFGVVGLSGAGKSTLVRCINLLERPDSGRIFVDGREMTAMNDRELRRARQNIGMISQNFNLFKRYSVWENVAFPLRLIRMPRAEVKDRVARLLELVGLADKAAAYPRQLSGGQQQRVAIARALANKPRVLLCDEPTSALDPVTAQSFLELLSAINRQLGLTIVLITHQMGVIRAVC